MRSKSGNQYIRTAKGSYFRKISTRKSIMIDKIDNRWFAFLVKEIGKGSFYQGEKWFEKYLICSGKRLSDTIETVEKEFAGDFYHCERM